MVSVDELKATINRMQIIADNMEDEKEKAFALYIKQNLTDFMKTVMMASENKDFVNALISQTKKD